MLRADLARAQRSSRAVHGTSTQRTDCGGELRLLGFAASSPLRGFFSSSRPGSTAGKNSRADSALRAGVLPGQARLAAAPCRFGHMSICWVSALGLPLRGAARTALAATETTAYNDPLFPRPRGRGEYFFEFMRSVWRFLQYSQSISTHFASKELGASWGFGPCDRVTTVQKGSQRVGAVTENLSLRLQRDLACPLRLNLIPILPHFYRHTSADNLSPISFVHFRRIPIPPPQNPAHPTVTLFFISPSLLSLSSPLLLLCLLLHLRPSVGSRVPRYPAHPLSSQSPPVTRCLRRDASITSSNRSQSQPAFPSSAPAFHTPLQSKA